MFGVPSSLNLVSVPLRRLMEVPNALCFSFVTECSKLNAEFHAPTCQGHAKDACSPGHVPCPPSHRGVAWPI